MSDHKLAEALRTGLEMTQELLALKRAAMGDDYRLTRDYWEAERELQAALAAHEAEQEQADGGKTVCPYCGSEWVTPEQHDRALAKQQQAGEAVAYAVYWGRPPMRKNGVFFDRKTAEEVAASIKGHATEVRPLFVHPQQPLSDEQIAVLKFLDGSGLLRGAGYGCLPDGERRPFWWRRQLGDAFPQIRAHGITKDTK